MSDNIAALAAEVNHAALAADFLAKLYPQGPWCVARINPTGGHPHVETFYPANRAGLEAWVAQHDGTFNLYYHINPVTRPLGKKADRTDIAALAYLHTDLDVDKKLPLADELQRLATLVQQIEPEPTALIFTGGGYQALWRLKEPIPLDGTIDAAEAAKVFNKALEQRWGGDNCHNIDRILRLPFTLNIPGARKQQAGRTTVRAGLEYFEAERSYDISIFPAWQGDRAPKTAKPSRGDSVTAVTIDDFDSWAAERGFSDDLKSIMRADWPQLRERYPSRSETMFYIVNEMRRRGVPQGEVLGFFLSFPDWPSTNKVWFKEEGSLDRRSLAEAERAARRELNNIYTKNAGSPPHRSGANHTAGTICVSTSELASIVDQTARMLIDKDAGLYLRGSQLVRLATAAEAEPEDIIQRDPEALVIKATGSHELVYLASAAGLTFVRIDKDGQEKPIQPPARLLTTVAATADRHGFPILNAIAATPSLTRNEPGYDAEGKVYLAFEAGSFGDIPMQPSKDEAVAALARLKEPVRAYKWGDEYSRSVWLAAALTSVVRARLRTCPLFGFTASVRGSGKTLLAQMVGVIGTGRRPPVATWGADDAENEKALKSILLAGDPVVNFDNVKVPIFGEAIEAVITEPTYKTRLLGSNDVVSMSTRALIMATGNKLRPGGDMARRMLLCTVDPGVEYPEDLAYEFNPLDDVMRERRRFVRDCLIVLRAYAAVEPISMRPFQSFGDFDVIRGALVWLGEPDPRGAMAAVREADPQDEGRYWVTKALCQTFGRHSFTARDVEGLAEQAELRKVLQRELGDRAWNAKRVGWLLKGLTHRPFRGVSLVSATNGKGFNEYRLVGQADLQIAEDLPAEFREPDVTAGPWVGGPEAPPF